MGRKLGSLLMLIAVAIPAFASGNSGSISGHVKNTAGIPQMGAAVEVLAFATPKVITVFTDSKGFYTVANLIPGTYDVKVSAPSFLPTLRENVNIHSGANMIINLTLNTLSDALRFLPPKTAGGDDDDWKWTLRSMSNRPILRLKDGTPVVVTNASDKSPLKASVAFMAGPEGEGFGSAGEMSTNFNMERSLFESGMLTFKGNVGTGPGPSGTVLRTSYSRTLPDGSKPEFAVTLRRFATTPQFAIHDAALEAISVSSNDSMTLAGLVDLHFGADFDAIQFMGRVNAFKPHGSIDLHLGPNTVLEYQYATAQPNTRRAKGFDSAPADLSESAPRVSLVDMNPVVEKARHQEISLSRRVGNTNFQIAMFTDHIANAALTGVGDFGEDVADILPDIYSDTFTYNGGVLNTNGVRMVVQRKINQNLTATADYSYGGALDLVTPGSGMATFHPVRRHSVSTKVTGTMPLLKTRWITSYRWTSGEVLTPVDMFNASAGMADPYLNIFIRQPVPGTGFMPVKMEALVDIRNALSQGYVQVVGPDGNTVYLVQSARSIRGGVAFVF